MRNTLLLLGILGLILSAIECSSQTTIHPKFGFMGIHPFDDINKHLYENSIDANHNFVIEPIVMVAIETMIRDDSFSWQIMPGFLSDAAAKPAFFIHTGLKLRLFKTWRHSFFIAAGGSLLGRQLWQTIPGYIEESNYSANGTWEYRLEPFGEIEYNIFINNKNDITFSGLYGYMHKSFTFTIGYRFWLSTTIKHPSNCGSCPFAKTNKKY